MMKALLSERLRIAVRDMEAHSRRRAQAEQKTKTEHQETLAAAEAEFREAEAQIQSVLASAQEAAIRAFQEKSQAIASQFEKEHESKSKEYSARRLKATTEWETTSQDLKTAYEEQCWTIDTIFEADRKNAKESLANDQRHVGTSVQRIDAKHQEIVRFARKWKLSEVLESVQVSSRAELTPDPFPALQQCVSTQELCHEQLQRLKAPKFLKGLRLVWVFAFVWLLLQIPALWMEEWYYWLGVSLVAILSIGIVVRYLLAHNLRVRLQHVYQIAKQAQVDSVGLQKRCLDACTARFQEESRFAKEKRDQSRQQADAQFSQSMLECTDRKEAELEQLRSTYEPRLQQLQQRRDAALKKAEAAYQHAMSESTKRYESDMEAATRRRSGKIETSQQAFRSSWQALSKEWGQEVIRFDAILKAVRQKCEQLFLGWDKLQGTDWPAATTVPAGMRFGTVRMGLEYLDDGIPQDERLARMAPPSLTVPALLGFPENGSLLLKAQDAKRRSAIQLMQAVMLRCLTSIPPGKVRFTIIDPVGLGENFAAFAHLADYDEKLVASRIWTEPQHIEQRLADLTEHIENVIQKYLRNQFNTLEEYNAQAGEVAEPYRFLVIAHFPVNFTEEAARRLISIASSGARCGIQTLIMVDTKLPMPRNFDLADLERDRSILTWKEGGVEWGDPDFNRFPLTLDEPPSPEQATSIIQVAGERAKRAGRVEVPFRHVAPPPERWWTGSTRQGIQVALGKAGATRKQYMELGEGTSQHVLIAGKTGSGKSTLLHALIVQLALNYSPDEMELYLIDFKKGVEFKTYALHELPHARVVAIESEREFGLSVLQRLDVELKLRADRFRIAGVQDLAAYRNAAAEPLPRVMLVVDEFQEFFVEDDRVAQESALLLDRLVRQGRAFGIHVLLGSQTLGGAYSLARSTIDQMAVRIALQCSETDGHLILSKDNSAARLLSRPGEAIYNNANGLVEGNNLFQIVWLSEENREDCLRQISEKAAQLEVPPRRLIVFEGNAPAHIEKNPLLKRLLEGHPPLARPGTYTAWLGDSIAIKEPTNAVFRKQSGCNLLMVGQHPEAALSILSAAAISLAAGAPSDEDACSQFDLLSNSSIDPRSETLFAQIADLFPQPIHVVGWRDLPNRIGELAEEVDRRLNDRIENAPPIFLCIYGLQHFRELRRDEDDFGFSRRNDNKPVPPSRRFTTILREGPMVGVFTLVWCDTLNNLQRTFDRQTLREFEMRVLFQMNANDSSNLIDSPAASKLGLYRALFYTEDQGKIEKFRPYGLPSEEWLASLKKEPTPAAAGVSD